MKINAIDSDNSPGIGVEFDSQITDIKDAIAHGTPGVGIIRNSNNRLSRTGIILDILAREFCGMGEAIALEDSTAIEDSTLPDIEYPLTPPSA
jgi:hypothetical protein